MLRFVARPVYSPTIHCANPLFKTPRAFTRAVQSVSRYEPIAPRCRPRFYIDDAAALDYMLKSRDDAI